MTTGPQSPERQRVPMTVIGGFLGAGKTTLLNAWLREAQGQRIAVLVNDFGALNIDRDLIASASGDTIALTNGCVCCQIGDDLSRALLGVLASATRFDAVVVEASGVSDPWRIAQLSLADPGLSLGGVVVLVDAAALQGHLADPLLADTMERQLRAADLIVVNKTDVVAPEELGRVHLRVAAIAPKTTRFETTQGRVPRPMLQPPAWPSALGPTSGLPCAAGCDGPDHDHDHDHDHGQAHGDGAPPIHGVLFQTWSAQPTGVFDAPALRRWMADMPEGVLRLKALLRTGDAEWSELQFAGRHASLRRASAVPRAGAAVVAIGLQGRLPQSALAAMFSGPAR